MNVYVAAHPDPSLNKLMREAVEHLITYILCASVGFVGFSFRVAADSDLGFSYIYYSIECIALSKGNTELLHHLTVCEMANKPQTGKRSFSPFKHSHFWKDCDYFGESTSHGVCAYLRVCAQRRV